MSRWTRYLIKGLMMVGLLFCLAPFAKAQGSCPTGSNYIDLTNPSNGGGYGSLALSNANAGGITHCWYFSSSGSDSNACTTEGSPCQHLPGMPNCSSTCASIKAAPGQGFIIEGGSVYHRSNGSPLMGGGWVWSWSGTSSNYVYVGVDPTWEIGGGSFTRPVLDQDNPLSTSIVSSCSYSDDGTTLMSVTGSYVIVDGLEAQGNCLSSSGVDSVFSPARNGHNIFERDYVHGWTSTSGVADDAGVKFGPNNTANAGENTDRFLFDVADGADSTNASCTSPSCVSSGRASGWGFEYAWDVEFSVIRHLSNGIEAGDNAILHDNDMEYLFEPTLSGRHGNLDEEVFSKNCTSSVAGLFYNNVIANVNEGNGMVLQCVNYYIFNNVMFNDQHYAPDPNAWILAGPDFGSCPGANSVIHVYWYNNTTQDGKLQAGPCTSNNEGGWASGSTITFGNNHIMDFSSISSFFSCDSGNSCSTSDNGGEVYQTSSAANSEGYTISNDFAPTSASAATVGAGKDASSFCKSIPDSLAAAACASGIGGVSEISAWGGEFAYYPRITVNARGSSWDAGAYQFSASAVSAQPIAPTALTAVVQ